MPTAHGKVAGMCTGAELDQLEAWEVAEMFGRLADAAREGVEYQASPRTGDDLHEALQKALWRWALGHQSMLHALCQLHCRLGSPGCSLAPAPMSRW